jgi:hypothetical protein
MITRRSIFQSEQRLLNKLFIGLMVIASSMPMATSSQARRRSATPTPTAVATPIPTPPAQSSSACADVSNLPIVPPSLVNAASVLPGASFGDNTVSGDGVTDDTAAFQAALNASDICIQSGATYAIYGTLNVPPNRNIQCQPGATILNPVHDAGNPNMTFAFGWDQPASNNSLVGCTIEGTDTSNPPQYDESNEYNYLTVIGAYGSAGVNHDVLIEGNAYKNGWTDELMTYAGTSDPNSGPQAVTVAANTFSHCGFHGTHPNGGQGLVFTNNVYDGCDVEPEFDSGINQNIQAAFTNEYVKDSHGLGNGDDKAIFMSPCGTGGGGYSRVQMMNNTLDGSNLWFYTAPGCDAQWSNNACINGAAGC